MIGYYVHHQGRGHLHRAQALAAVLEEPVTGLSSLPRPDRWQGPWVRLPRDDEHPTPYDVTAGGCLHWAPLGDPGMRSRSAAVSRWLDRARPRLVVVDVSVEVALLARLHGTPVVSVVLPGRRTDPAHLLGFRASTALVTFSPLPADRLVPDLPDDVAARVRSVGAVSRFAPATAQVRRRGDDRPPHVVVLQGRGGGCLTPLSGAALRALAPRWRWSVAGGADGWVEDVSRLLQDADVVVTNAGESALADVAAHRRPAIVIPAERPFGEQEVTAALLADGGWPAMVRSAFPPDGWEPLLDRAVQLDGRAWEAWCDGGAVHRFAQLLRDVAAVPARSA